MSNIVKRNNGNKQKTFAWSRLYSADEFNQPILGVKSNELKTDL